MGAMSPVHWLIVLVVLVVLFGAKRLPDASRSLGRSMRIFKSEVKEMKSDDADSPPPTAVTSPEQPSPASVAAPPAAHVAAPTEPQDAQYQHPAVGPDKTLG